NGDITLNVTKSGDVALVKHPDGSDTAISSNHSKITRDVDGKVTKVESPDGTSTDIEYDGKDIKSTTNHPSGNTWKKEGDTWVRRDANGNKTGPEADNIEVGPDGDLKFSMKDSGGQEITLHPDGSVTNKSLDNVTTTEDANGHITKITQPDGKGVD